MVYSKVLLCAAMTSLVYHNLAGAAPMNTKNNKIPDPILHLDDNQMKQFKHTNPAQSEPDIAFPKDADGIYAIADEVPQDTEALEMGIELHSIDNVELMDTMEDVVLMEQEEDNVVEEKEEGAEEEEPEVAASADQENEDELNMEAESTNQEEEEEEEEEDLNIKAAVMTEDDEEEDEQDIQAAVMVEEDDNEEEDIQEVVEDDEQVE
ncbi:hypothetical protein BDA99DRAFT_539211 [Phascolomyces articulosus]|uniref:Uncharacterized protein n=1 Tax=Phascolomyces articulosus TaxID=60185 RepID=A0AAD5KA79_9FUNG|nr:hypothetical protein BDA99DRAFT_539211 [Phascolomyces articulosus]